MLKLLLLLPFAQRREELLAAEAAAWRVTPVL